MLDKVSLTITTCLSLFITHQQVRQLEEKKAHSQQMAEQAQQRTRELAEEKTNMQQMLEEAQQRIRTIEVENRDLHRQVQQLQEQVSSVVFHHTCTVCGVCRWLLLCPHTHSWQERSSPTGL